MDLEAMRASGYQGALDLEGYDVRLDRRSGEPVVRRSDSVRAQENPDDAYWAEGFDVPGIGGPIHALTVFEDKLIAGGWFNAAGDVGANCVAAWDGSAWSELGSGWDGTVSALTVYDNKLVAGGWFTTAGGVEANYIAIWDGSSWSALGSGMTWSVGSLTVYDNKLIAGGGFGTAGGVEANRIAAWDGSTWSLLPTGDDIVIGAMATYDNKLIAGGQFNAIAGIAANNIVAWDGSAWSALGPGGINNTVSALTVYDNALVAGGSFITAGDVEANHIAAWDGSAWLALQSGMNGSVLALTAYDNKLIAGGQFSEADGLEVNYIAAWDGRLWWPLGSGMDHSVYALSLYDNKLVAGGEFSTAGGVGAKGIATWDGSAWSWLGSGMRFGVYPGFVYALAVYDNKLIAGGWFTTAGGVGANYVAAWDGSTWSPLGSGLSGLSSYEPEVLALAVYDNKLIAGGAFTNAGGAGANCIAAWDGSAWSALGSGMDDWVQALTVYDNKLIAGGLFWEAGGVEANHIAVWNGSAWSPLGSGADWWVHELSVYNNTLMVGGEFTSAGNKASGHIAQWTKHTSTATLLQSFAASHQGSAIEIEWELSEQVPNESFVVERAERAVERSGSPGDFVELHGAQIAENDLHYSFNDSDIEPGMTYRYRVALRSEVGFREVLFETEAIAIPALALTLYQNQPNPFNPSTMIRYYLPEDTEVTLGVYDAAGRLVVSLAEREKQPGGYHELEWNGRDSRGKAVASGVYFCRLGAGKQTRTLKIILLR